MGADGYESKVYIDREFQFSAKMKYSGIANNAYGEEGDPDHMKYTIQTTQAKVKFGLKFDPGTNVLYSLRPPESGDRPSYGSGINQLIQSRMPGTSFSYIVKAEDGSLIKQETVSFHGPNRMIVEEAANDVAMITVYEKQ